MFPVLWASDSGQRHDYSPGLRICKHSLVIVPDTHSDKKDLMLRAQDETNTRTATKVIIIIVIVFTTTTTIIIIIINKSERKDRKKATEVV